MREVKLLFLFLGLLACLGSIQAQVAPGDITIELDLVAEGLTSPVTATHAGDGSGRLFVVDQAGLVRIVDNGVLLPLAITYNGVLVALAERKGAVVPFSRETYRASRAAPGTVSTRV